MWFNMILFCGVLTSTITLYAIHTQSGLTIEEITVTFGILFPTSITNQSDFNRVSYH